MNIDGLFQGTNIALYAGVILKGLGIAFIAQGCAAVCRECGKASLAGFVELAGKLEIFILCLPLITEIIGTAVGLLELK